MGRTLDELKFKELREAALDINKVLNPNIPVPTKVGTSRKAIVEELGETITDLAEDIAEEKKNGNFYDLTLEVITAVAAAVSEGGDESAEQQSGDEGGETGGSSDNETPESSGETEGQENLAGEETAPEEGGEDEKPPQAPPAEKKKSGGRKTRAHCAAEIIADNPDAHIKDLIPLLEERYGVENYKQAYYILGQVRTAYNRFVELGIIKR